MQIAFQMNQTVHNGKQNQHNRQEKNDKLLQEKAESLEKENRILKAEKKTRVESILLLNPIPYGGGGGGFFPPPQNRYS